jgi:lipopolysaccharide export system protein LptA
MAFFLAKGANPGAPDAGTSRGVSPKDMKYPVVIHSDNLEILEKKQTAIWSGHAKVKRDTTDLRCDRLIAHYTKDQEVTRIECLGNVEVFDGDK